MTVTIPHVGVYLLTHEDDIMPVYLRWLLRAA